MPSYRQPGVVLTDHTFAVPLDHENPGGEQIEVFAREVVAAGEAPAGLPWLLFLQGGPGFGGPRLSGRSAWLDRALSGYRVLLLDQRGTGRSTPVTRHAIAARGSARDQARYLSLFRADAIVADAELLPGLSATADDVYRATYPRVRAKTLAHYARYPGDVDQARRIARRLQDSRVLLPDGSRLTVAAFQSLGHRLGQGTGSDELHYLLEGAFAGDQFSDAFLHDVHGQLTFAAGPLYAVLHEPCYAQGAATRWSAERLLAEFGEFDPGPALDGERPLLFTGEMIYPWMLERDPVLRPFQPAADLLAGYENWPALYDPSRLAANEVPVAAAVYFDDMYVPRELSVPTAEAIRGLRSWVTSEYEHDGLRVSSGVVLDRLIELALGLA